MHKKQFIVILAAALATILGMTGCQRLINGPAPTPVEFEAGTVEQDALSITMVITAQELSKLDEGGGEIEKEEVDLYELTREVREHNGFARRMPVVEEQIKVINHRLTDLEDFHKPN